VEVGISVVLLGRVVDWPLAGGGVVDDGVLVEASGTVLLLEGVAD